MTRLGLLLLAVIAVPAAPLTSQAPLRFEVVSIKPSSGDSGNRMISAGGSQFHVVNLPLKTIVNYAYDLRDIEIVDAPAWTTSEIFDITGLEGPGKAGNIKPGMDVNVRITRANGKIDEIKVLCRIDTAEEVEYFRHGGVLPYVLRNLAAS